MGWYVLGNLDWRNLGVLTWLQTTSPYKARSRRVPSPLAFAHYRGAQYSLPLARRQGIAFPQEEAARAQ